MQLKISKKQLREIESGTSDRATHNQASIYRFIRERLDANGGDAEKTLAFVIADLERRLLYVPLPADADLPQC